MIRIAHPKTQEVASVGVRWSADKPASAAGASSAEPVSAETIAYRKEKAVCIHQRIEARLSNRIRRLEILVEGDAFVLSGECSTFYSKQMAQHVAMGVLENERLINNIVVCPPM